MKLTKLIALVVIVLSSLVGGNQIANATDNSLCVSEHDVKIDNLSGDTYIVPTPPNGWVIIAVSVKAGNQEYLYQPVTPSQVLNVKDDTGHAVSHVHLCKNRIPNDTTSTSTSTTTTEATTSTSTSTTTTSPSTTTTVPVDTSTSTSTSVEPTTTTSIVPSSTTSEPSPSTTLPISSSTTSSTTPLSETTVTTSPATTTSIPSTPSTSTVDTSSTAPPSTQPSSTTCLTIRPGSNYVDGIWYDALGNPYGTSATEDSCITPYGELPATGIPLVGWIAIGIALIAAGLLLLGRKR